MPIITIVILVYSRQDKTRQDKTRQDKTRQDKTRQDKTRQDKTKEGKISQDKTKWNIHRFVAYNDNVNDNDNHYSMNSDGIKIIS